MYEKILILQVFSKSRSIFIEKTLVFEEKWGELYKKVFVGFTSVQ